MAQSTDSEHGQASPRQGSSLFQCPVAGEPGTEKRSCLDRGKTTGNLQHMRGWRLHEFRVPAVDGYAGDFLTGTKIFVVGSAEFTLTAAPVNPRQTHEIANAEIPDATALLDHSASNLVPED